MDVILIDRETFEQVTQRLNEFVNMVNKLCEKNSPETKWLDNQDVCRMLDISKRTLQNYRDRGLLPFSQVGHKCYYRISDIELLIKNKAA